MSGKRVLVARLDNDGDVLLAGPAVRAVAAGTGSVTLWCGPRGRQAAALLPGVNGVIEAFAEWIDPEPPSVSRARTDALIDLLADVRADEALILTSFHQSPLPAALLLRMAGVGHIGAISEDYPGSLLDVRHHVDAGLHEVERGLSLAAAMGFTLPPHDDARLAVTDTIGGPSLPDPYVVVHPGASVPARAWSPTRHAALVDGLVARGHHVVVTGGLDEVALTALVSGPPRRDVTDLGGRTGLGALAGVLAGARIVIVGNTGPAHLAAAVGTPVVSLFAPTVPVERWRPWRVPHRVLHTEVGCAGCRARHCPIPGHPCLEGVDVQQVLRAVSDLTRVPQREAV